MQKENKEFKIKFKNAKIQSAIKKTIIKNPKIKHVLNIDEWWIIANSYKQDQFDQVFKLMEQNSAIEIFLCANQHQEILKEIHHVRYTNLKQLDLRENKINNIEPLSLMNFKQIQLINLSYNQITQVNSLKKCLLPIFNCLLLGENPITQTNSLTKLKGCDDQFSLCLQWFQHDNPSNQDLSLILKLSCKSMDQLSDI